MPIESIRRYLLDRMVLRPSRHPIEYPHQERRVLKCGGRELECFVQCSQPSETPPDLLVLKFPGTAGRAERASEFPSTLLDVPNWAIWTWNPPGYGRSDGRASLPTIAAAATCFYDHVVSAIAGPTTSVWLCGNSLGCLSALHVAADRKPDRSHTGLLLRNPPPLGRVVQRIADRYPHFGFVNPIIASLCDPMDALATSRLVDLPGVFLQSELDTLVPVEFQNEIIDLYGGESQVVLMEGLGHGCLATETHEPLIENAIDWLWNKTRFNPNHSDS